MKMKKIAVLMTLVLMLCAMPLTVFAEQPVAPMAASNPPATPNWNYTYHMSGDLYYEGTTMECVSTVVAYEEVTSITIKQTLQKQGLFWSWSKYDNDSEWEETFYDSSVQFPNEKTVTEKGKYRLETVATVTNEDGKSETITIYSEIVTI